MSNTPAVTPDGYVKSRTSVSGLQISEEEASQVAAASAAIAKLKPTIMTWTIFLEARSQFIQYAIEVEHLGLEEIASNLSCDPTQIRMIYEIDILGGRNSDFAYHNLHAAAQARKKPAA